MNQKSIYINNLIQYIKNIINRIDYIILISQKINHLKSRKRKSK